MSRGVSLSVDSPLLHTTVLEDPVTNFQTACKIAALTAASYLTDPMCKIREYFYSYYTLDATCPTAALKAMKVAFLTLGIAACTLLTPFTAPFGLAIRAAVIALESKPFIYLEKAKMGKILPEDKQITLVSHNQCYMPGGYSISDGHVTPPSDKGRMDANIQEIKRLDPDIVCLYEVADICDAEYLSSQMPEYPFLIPVAGVRAIGPSSMMYIASKYEIVEDSIEFTPFIKGVEVIGVAENSEKGVLSFDIKSRGENVPFASVISTHLQHSEVSAKPEDSDRKARAAAMDRVAGIIERKIEKGRNIIFTGDLNQSEEELSTYLSQRQIDWLHRDESIRGQNTWGGDEWCAKIMNKEPSEPMVLDYTFIAGKAEAIQTRIFETDYSGKEFRAEARSDHYLLFSTITVGD